MKTTTPKITPPFHHEIAGISTSSHDENPTNKKSEQPLDHLKTTVSTNKRLEATIGNNNVQPNTTKTLTKELKMAFTKAALQHWIIVAQHEKIQEIRKFTQVANKNCQ